MAAKGEDRGLAEARRLLAKLRARLPCAFPVRLSTKRSESPTEYIAAHATFTGKSYVIHLGHDARSQSAIEDAIIHEYAHCRVWGRLQAQTYDHDAHWGIEYAAVYREANEVQ